MGGGALTGNYYAKQANPDEYNITLDQFSQDIVDGSYEAIEKDYLNGGPTAGILNAEEMQVADHLKWSSKLLEFSSNKASSENTKR